MNIKYTCLALLLVVVYCVAAMLEDVSGDVDQEQYCSMVAEWSVGAARGIPQKDRVGWPPFKGEGFCDGK
jgi:hypothetical protein